MPLNSRQYWERKRRDFKKVEVVGWGTWIPGQKKDASRLDL